jgi:hypothetical protein
MKNQRISQGLYAVAVLLFLIACISCNKDDTTKTMDTIAQVVNNCLMVATGQIKLYNADVDEFASQGVGYAFYGQDGTDLKVASMSYTDNGDSTITGNSMGLLWI